MVNATNKEIALRSLSVTNLDAIRGTTNSFSVLEQIQTALLAKKDLVDCICALRDFFRIRQYLS